MSNQINQSKVKPNVVNEQIKLPNKENIKVNSNAVNNTGRYLSAKTIIKELKKASKAEIFPPLVSP